MFTVKHYERSKMEEDDGVHTYDNTENTHRIYNNYSHSDTEENHLKTGMSILNKYKQLSEVYTMTLYWSNEYASIMGFIEYLIHTTGQIDLVIEKIVSVHTDDIIDNNILIKKINMYISDFSVEMVNDNGKKHVLI